MTKLTSIAIFIAGMLASTHAISAEPIEVITAAKITEPEKVELGKMLFFEPRLSKSGFISCNSCHNLSTGGVDALPTSIGHHWQEGPINSPTVLNADFMLALRLNRANRQWDSYWQRIPENLYEQLTTSV